MKPANGTFHDWQLTTFARLIKSPGVKQSFSKDIWISLVKVVIAWPVEWPLGKPTCPV